MNAELLAQNIAAHWVQSGLLVVAALFAIRLFSTGASRARLAALHLTLLATLLLPLLQPWRAVESPAQAVTATGASVSYVTKFFVVNVETPRPARLDVGIAAVLVLLTGIAVRLLWLCGGIIRLLRFRSRAREISTPPVARALEAMLGISPRYVEHSEYSSPATFGILGGTVVLPRAFDHLDVSMQQAIACHELLHVKRHDAAIAAIEELVASVLWFHPWVWVLRSRIRVAREQVVDRQVVELLGNPEVYVRCLVEISGHDLIPHLSTGMSSSRELRTRIDEIFEEMPMSHKQLVVRFAAYVVLAAGMVWLGTSVAPLRAQDRVTARDTDVHTVVAIRQPLSGLRRPIKVPAVEYPADALEKRIGGIVVVDLAINAAGEVTTAAVAGGPEELRASALKAAMGLKFEPQSRTTALPVVVTYTIRSDSTGVHMSWGDAGSWRAVGGRRTPLPQDATAVVSEQNATSPEAAPPKKIKDVAPRYPAAAREARVQGAVVLEASIDTKGRVIDARPLRSIPLLDEAARDAVLQWQYEATLVDGKPAPITLTVTVNFVLREEATNR